VTPIDKSDVFVVTGGARGITPLCVRELAKLTGGGTFLLMGRSTLKEQPAWANGKQTGKELDAAATAFAKAEFASGKGEKPTPKLGTSFFSLLPLVRCTPSLVSPCYKYFCYIWFGLHRTLWSLKRTLKYWFGVRRTLFKPYLFVDSIGSVDDKPCFKA
jgi:hypothetical protein